MCLKHDILIIPTDTTLSTNVLVLLHFYTYFFQVWFSDGDEQESHFFWGPALIAERECGALSSLAQWQRQEDQRRKDEQGAEEQGAP